MLPVLQIGPLALPTADLLLMIGFWVGLELAEKQSERFGIASGPIFNLIVIGLVSGLIGARLAYALRYPFAFAENPLNLLVPRPQMLDASAGLLVAVLAGLAYSRVRKLPLWPLLDVLTTLFSVLAIAVGLAHFASGDAFGAPAGVPWRVELWGEQRHPVQMYETLLALLIAAAVWPGQRIARHSLGRPGFRFWSFLAFSAAARLILETFRGDSLVLWNIFRAAQVIAWLVLAVSLWQIGRRLPAPDPRPEEPIL